MINIKINNMPYEVEENITILDACQVAGIKIPTLCHLKKINCIGACRICVVEVKGARTLVASCVHPVANNMEIFTNTKKVIDSRRTTIELMLSDHDQNCLSCARNTNCELQTLSIELGCNSTRFSGEKNELPIDKSTAFIIRDNNKCILCRRCEAVCSSIQGCSIIGANDRGFKTHIGTMFEQDLTKVACVGCGQCINICPTGALREREEIDNVRDALADPSKTVIVASAPAVRVGLGEEFGLPYGTNVEKKMVTALKSLGFDFVFDVDFAADLTIMEEGAEFIGRVKNNGILPMITSCSPAWIKFVEHNYPSLLGHLSSCKSPQQMYGAIAKTYFAEKIGKDPADLYVVSIMPCVAKKFEKTRDNQNASGYPDIDAVLTTRELAKLFKSCGIMLPSMPDNEFDAPMGISSGAGVIFGTTGGVMEAALRTVADVLTGKDIQNIDYTVCRGMEGVKEASLDINGIVVNVAIASSLVNAKTILESIQDGTCKYHFIEIMSCPGGCVNGGGQPIHSIYEKTVKDIPSLRMEGLYNIDKNMTYRKSHKNPAIIELYASYLGEPNSHKAHKILHTSYVKRDKF